MSDKPEQEQNQPNINIKTIALILVTVVVVIGVVVLLWGNAFGSSPSPTATVPETYGDITLFRNVINTL